MNAPSHPPGSTPPLARLVLALLACSILSLPAQVKPRQPAPGSLSQAAIAWRQQHALIDLHQHVHYSTSRLERAVGIMDRAGVGVGVNLSGGTVTRSGESPSAFARNKALADRLFPERFVHYMNLDYKKWNDPDWAEHAVRQINEGHRLGAAGLKEWKRLGLYLRDDQGNLIKIDDPKLDPVWKRCAELNLPVSIHVADPLAFWLPYNANNERWKELKDHRSWWFGDPDVFPPREILLAARNRVIARHPETVFVCVHFANNPEDIDTVDQWLDTYPNMQVDLAARVPEIGRHDPQKVHRLFVKHQDRILFATDFMVYNQLTLGSGGSGPPPDDDDAVSFYRKHWRWLETWDRNFPHMTPIQGDWTISGIGLPEPVLRKIYFDNARKLLGRSLPPPILRAARVLKDFRPDGTLTHAAWAAAQPVKLEYQSRNYNLHPLPPTQVRALWSGQFLYLGFSSPYTELTAFHPPRFDQERQGLWNRDVVEAFIGPDPEKPGAYLEFEVAPTNEKLDLSLDLPERNFAWDSGFATATHVDTKARIWTCSMRIPLKALSPSLPEPGTIWNLNLYRCDRANEAYLAWNPTLQGSFHAPDRFGKLKFEKAAPRQ